ncbi:hypothetical protein [Rhodoferax sp.]|uniref:hypothetical protein n=1 Tax=Rhodoferax sp. TaxID=50421 RepID=UPI00277069C8|nr:hypothetical protein [Rhodoferax sp.]
MANTMSKADLTASLKESLHDAASVFAGEAGPDVDAAFDRFLLQALPDMGIKRPATRLGTVELTANIPRVAVGGSNPGFSAFKTYLWGDDCLIPVWDPTHPGSRPRVSASFSEQQWWLVFDPAPTIKQIAAYGTRFDFWYYAAHAIGALAADTTVNAQDRGLLLLRAQVEAMRELSIRNASKPVAMRDGFSGQPRNSTAAALYTELLKQFQTTP